MIRIGDIGERQLIKDFNTFIRKGAPLGPGDDAAILENNTVVTTDVVTFDRHFPAGMTYEQFGWYAAAVSFSDLAAMGARPIGITAALALPSNLDAQAAYDIMSGIDQCAEFCETTVVGGDTKEGNGVVTCTAIGMMDDRKPMLRSGAKVGDMIAITGPLGGPAAGFYAIEHQIECQEARDRLYTPIPRIREGMLLSKSKSVSSCMDLSDGLATALNTICEASGVGMSIEYDFLIHYVYVEEVAKKAGIPVEKLLLDFGGEYELVFTADKDDLVNLYDQEIDFLIIGKVTDEEGVTLMNDGEAKKIGYGDY